MPAAVRRQLPRDAIVLLERRLACTAVAGGRCFVFVRRSSRRQYTGTSSASCEGLGVVKIGTPGGGSRNVVEALGRTQNDEAVSQSWQRRNAGTATLLLHYNLHARQVLGQRSQAIPCEVATALYCPLIISSSSPAPQMKRCAVLCLTPAPARAIDASCGGAAILPKLAEPIKGISSII